MAKFTTSTKILNSVYSGTTLKGFSTDSDVLNAVYDSENGALRISLDGLQVKEISGISYTITSSDSNKILEVVTGSTLTFDDGLKDGFHVDIVSKTTETITLSATTLNTKNGNTTITSQYGAVSAYASNSGEITAIGDLA